MKLEYDTFWVAACQAAARLGFAFPPSFRAVGSLTEVETTGWHLWPIHEWTRVSTALAGWDHGVPHGALDHDGYAGPDGIVIGGDDAGNVVCLLLESDSRTLGEPVFQWDHETGEFNQLAARMSELPELLDRRAASLLSPSAVGSPSYFLRPDLAKVDNVCGLCGSGMQGGTKCLVCFRDATDTPEQDTSREIALKLLDRLVHSNLLELDRPSALGRLSTEIAEIFDAHSDASEAASECCRLLMDDPAVRELHAEDDVVAELLRALTSSVPQRAV